MTAAAGGRPGLGVIVFDQPAMAGRAAAMKGFPQGRFVIVLPADVAFQAAELFTLPINEFAGWVVLHMVTDAASSLIKRFGMNLMGESDRRPSQLAKNILISQIVLSILGTGNVPSCNAAQNKSNDDQPQSD